MAESGVPMTAPNSTPLHRGCEGPMRVSEGCYDKNQTGPEERALETSPIHFLSFSRPDVPNQGEGMVVFLCRLQGRIDPWASFSFWRLLASLGLCPHYSSLCLVFMRILCVCLCCLFQECLSLNSGVTQKIQNDLMLRFLITPAKSFSPKEAIFPGLTRSNK